jgi:hypothetical protein
MATKFNNIALVGWGVTLGSVVAYDTWAIRTRRPTMSRTLGHYLAHPVLGPVLAGAWSGLSYHLLVEELLPAFFDSRASKGH